MGLTPVFFTPAFSVAPEQTTLVFGKHQSVVLLHDSSYHTVLQSNCSVAGAATAANTQLVDRDNRQRQRRRSRGVALPRRLYVASVPSGP